jgi:elongation factor 2
VAVSVRPKKASDQAAYSKALQKLAKTDNLVQITFDAAAGETVIAGAGELHLEIVLAELRSLAKVELLVGDPVIALRETVVGHCPSSLAKSGNKHNRVSPSLLLFFLLIFFKKVFMACEPMAEALRVAMEQGRIPSDAKERNALLTEHPEMGVDGRSPKKLWALGGEAASNVLLDGTHGVDYLHEVQSVFLSAVNRLVVNGPLCGEPVHGVSWAVQDVKLHADRAHRSDLLEAVRRALSGSLLQAQPRLLEPVLLCTIECPRALVGTLYTFLAARQARVAHEEQHEGAPLATLTVHLPALQSLGFDAALRKVSSGAVFCSLAFSHHQLIDSDPLAEGSLAHRLVAEKRKRKNLGPLDPSAFIDKL